MTKVRVGSGIQVKAGRPSNVKVSEDGNFKGSQPEINFTGNANVSNDPTNNRVNVDIASGGGSGDVTGPSSSTDGELVLFNGATGKIIKASSKVLTTIGGNIAALTNPGAITFLRLNADNTVTARTAAQYLSDMGALASAPSSIIKGTTYNRWHGSGKVYASPSSNSSGVNTLRASTFQVNEAITIDTIQTEVVTLVGGSSFRLGIYSDNGSFYPGSLILDTGSLSGAANAVVPFTITPNLTLQPGLYWLVIVADAAISFRVDSTAAFETNFGILNTMGGTFRQPFYTVAHTYGALPNPFTAGAAINNSANFIAQILVRAI
jgi:hypothetical protein